LTDLTDEQAEAWIDEKVAMLPKWACRAIAWVRAPERKWIRLGLGIVSLAAWPFSWLPVLGFWTLPLGLLLISQDIPRLKRACVRAGMWIEKKIQDWRRRN
jgi:hypothetical protein